MRSLAVVEFQIPTDPGARLADAVVGAQIDFFVFDRAPVPLDEDVVTPGRLAVHADRDGVVEKQTDERGTGELAALIGTVMLRVRCCLRAESAFVIFFWWTST
jgi:hypothetical protein